MHAEQAYLFRHALLRQAAYQLQLPGDRAKLHALAFEILELFISSEDARNSMAEEMALHAREARGLDAQRVIWEARELQWLWIAAKHADRQCRSAEAARAFSLIAAHPACDLRQRFDATMLQGRMHFELRQMEAARRCYGFCLESVIQLGMPEFAAKLRANVANIEQVSGNIDAAVRTYREAGELARSAGSALFLAQIEANFAECLLRLGQTKEASVLFESAIAGLRAGGDRLFEGIALTNYANLLRRQGQLEQAERALSTALSLAQHTLDRRGEGAALSGLAKVYAQSGRQTEAEELCRRALGIHVETGNRYMQSLELDFLSGFLEERGEVIQSRDMLIRAIALAEEGEINELNGATVVNLALVELRLGARHEAREIAKRGIDILRRNSETLYLEDALSAWREACVGHGCPELAEIA